MSDVAGLMVLEKRQNQFLGGQTQKDFSDDMAKNLDRYVKDVLNKRYADVIESLEEHKDAIEEMTAELLEIEVISGERVREVIKAHGGKVFEEEDLHSEAITTNEKEESKDDNQSANDESNDDSNNSTEDKKEEKE